MLEQSIRDFPKQFAFAPQIQNAEKLKRAGKFIVCGMGGSAHPSALLKIRRPELDLVVHRSYGLPRLPAEDLKERLVLTVSFSGNTAEPIDAYDTARQQNLPLAAVATGGKLLAQAQRDGVPYVALPGAALEPRSGMGYTLRAVLALIGDAASLQETAALAHTLDPTAAEISGQSFAKRLHGKVPVVYASDEMGYLAYVWKIKFNETAKIPAFCHKFPELNHNEMNGFDFVAANRSLAERFHFVILRDAADEERIQKRMAITQKLLEDRGFGVEIIELKGKTVWEKIFSSLLVADWTSVYLAKSYDVAPEGQPMVEAFKKLIK